MVKVSTGTIISLIMGIIFLTIFLSVARTTIPIGATEFYNITDNVFEGHNATGGHGGTLSGDVIFGTGASAFGSTLNTYVGWFWVIGPFVLVIVLVLGLFNTRR